MGEQYYPSIRIHIAPTGYFHGGRRHNHIDMYVLLLEQTKLLILDTCFGRGAGTAKEYDQIAEQEGFRLVRYDGSQDGVEFPLNALVLPSLQGNTDFVVTDKKSASLNKLLLDEGAETVLVDMPLKLNPGGKIHCQTNTCGPGDNPEDYLDDY